MNPTTAGDFYSPIEVAERLQAISEKSNCTQFRVSGAEPILGRTSTLHLAEVIRLVGGHFIIETNGVAIGYDIGLLDLLGPLIMPCQVNYQGRRPGVVPEGHRGLGRDLLLSTSSSRCNTKGKNLS